MTIPWVGCYRKESGYELMKRQAFVTGATGFFGRNLVEELAHRDWEITALCLPTDNTELLKGPGINVVTGNITDRESLVAAMPNAPDAVFHVAANTSSWSAHDAQQYQDNVIGTGNMLDVALLKERSASCIRLRSARTATNRAADSTRARHRMR